jgi:hypothetical protein
MTRLVIQVIGVAPDTQEEIILAKIESDRFDPDHLEAQVGLALDSALASIQGADLDMLGSWNPEVSVVLTADEEQIRPSLHLTAETMQLLVKAGASFDFDPYV